MINSDISEEGSDDSESSYEEGDMDDDDYLEGMGQIKFLIPHSFINELDK